MTRNRAWGNLGGVERIERASLPVYSWAPDLEEGAIAQALNCANLPVAHHHVAVMADGHQGYGVPIGAVLALSDAISPYSVGNDIGCGMALVPTALTRAEFLSPLPTGSGAAGAVARDDLMGRVQAQIPSGMAGSRKEPDTGADALLHEAFDRMEEAASVLGMRLSAGASVDDRKGPALLRAAFVDRGRHHAGTLGSGNHFVEVLAGPDDDVWVMLHSGSRGVGGMVCNNFHRMALRYCEETGQMPPDPGLAWLPLAGDDRFARAGRCYERALRAALDYAERNRRRMLEEVGAIVEARFPGAMRWDGAVNIHHNDATAERHYGADVWVHRKGAVKAQEGTPTVIPGSMGTGSYLGRGLGNAESFASCSHGAGRVMSRGRARRELSLRDQLDLVAGAGSKLFAASDEAVLDEMPAAYKDLDAVMANQADLVEPVRRFRPLATYKGADAPRRRKGKWRPEEER